MAIGDLESEERERLTGWEREHVPGAEARICGGARIVEAEASTYLRNNGKYPTSIVGTD